LKRNIPPGPPPAGPIAVPAVLYPLLVVPNPTGTMQRLSAAEALQHLAASSPHAVFGLSLWATTAPLRALPASAGEPYRLTLLPVPGARPWTIAVACSPAAATLLASLMFGCALGSVDARAADDSLRELTNIVAGQMKSVLAPDQALGLPRVEATDELAAEISHWRAAQLKKGDHDLRLWIGVVDRVVGAPV
jgi:hypothetical protein